MGLADELLAGTALDEAPCPFPGILDTLAQRDAEALRWALVPKHKDTDDIRRSLRRNGIAVTRLQLRRHRQGWCGCVAR